MQIVTLNQDGYISYIIVRICNIVIGALTFHVTISISGNNNNYRLLFLLMICGVQLEGEGFINNKKILHEE